MSGSRRGTVLGIVAVAGLASVLALETALMNRWYSERQAALQVALEAAGVVEQGGTVAVDPGPSPTPAAHLRERPLFVASRRPPSETVDEVEAVQLDDRDVRDLVLVSTVITADVRYAQLRDKSSSSRLVLSVGDRHGQWQVERIDADRLHFRSNGTRHVLQLRPQQDDLLQRSTVRPEVPVPTNAGASGP